MIQSYTTIFFDAGGTLLHPFPSVGEIYEQIGKRHGSKATSEQLQNKFSEEWKKRNGLSQLTGVLDEKIEKEWWKSIVKDVFDPFGKINDFDAFFDELYHVFASPQSWKLYPGTIEVLESLRRQGKRLAIISNWDSRLFHLCDELDLTRHFEFILASAVFGSSKPGPKIFEEALSRMSARPSEALHIGDSFEDDIKGASSIGIHTALIDRHGHYEPHPSHPVRPRHVIRDLRELIDTPR
ncbi:MAG: HAD family hydrolase [Candidatus Omnitrophica bacterium]|nr:HAD family hydrolase [Candidatus Omnitrophota bacterium]